MSMIMNSDDNDTITISSSIFPFDNDSGIVSFSQSDNGTDRPLSTGCAEEFYEQVPIIAKEPSTSEEKLENYSTGKLLKELMRRGQLATTNVMGISESNDKGNIDGRDQLAVALNSGYKEVDDPFVNKASFDEGIGSMETLDENFFKLKVKRSSLVTEEIVQVHPSTPAAVKKSDAIMEAAIKREKDKMHSTKKNQLFMKKQETLAKLIIDNSSLDVAFMVDCTGSMSKYLDQTKENIEFIVNSIKEEFENKVKIAFVGYRDHGDGDSRIECLSFTEDVGEFKEFVAGIKATGGGDRAEDVLGGLEAVTNLTWTCKNKVLIHVGDAPQHGPRFHDLGKKADRYYDKEPRGLKVENLLDKIKLLNVKYFFAKINSSTDKMVNEFNCAAGYTLVKNINLKSPDLIAHLVLKSITQTLDESISDTMRTYQLSADGSGKLIYSFYFFSTQVTSDTQVINFLSKFSGE